MNLLILDDERFYDDITWVDYPDWQFVLHVCNPKAFIWHIAFYEDWDAISFDHDLAWTNSAGKDVTGYDCLKWLCRYLDRHPEVKIPEAFFHSKNPVGVTNMKGYWYNWLEHRQPGGGE